MMGFEKNKKTYPGGGGKDEVHNKYVTTRSHSNVTQSVNFKAISEKL